MRLLIGHSSCQFALDLVVRVLADWVQCFGVKCDNPVIIGYHVLTAHAQYNEGNFPQ